MTPAAFSQPAFARPLEEIEKTGRMTVFVYKNYHPYSWIENGEVLGIDADIARRIAENLGFELDFLIREADENVDDDLRVNVWKGDIIEHKAADLMLHVPYDRELEIRAESLAILFNPYFDEEFAVVFDGDRLEKVDTFGSFVARPIAVEVDTASDFFLSNAFRGQLQESIRRGRYFMDVVKQLESGEVGAAMMTEAQAEWVRYRNPDRNLRIAQPPMPGIVRSHWPIGMAVKQDSRDLGYAVGDIIDQLNASGELGEIFARYGVEYRSPRIE
jgi:ABC-type amino acid transport substrate-binding protein